MWLPGQGLGGEGGGGLVKCRVFWVLGLVLSAGLSTVLYLQRERVVVVVVVVVVWGGG
jgi:hypothetical protein